MRTYPGEHEASDVVAEDAKRDEKQYDRRHHAQQVAHLLKDSLPLDYHITRHHIIYRTAHHAHKKKHGEEDEEKEREGGRGGVQGETVKTCTWCI